MYIWIFLTLINSDFQSDILKCNTKCSKANNGDAIIDGHILVPEKKIKWLNVLEPIKTT